MSEDSYSLLRLSSSEIDDVDNEEESKNIKTRNGTISKYEKKNKRKSTKIHSKEAHESKFCPTIKDSKKFAWGSPNISKKQDFNFNNLPVIPEKENESFEDLEQEYKQGFNRTDKETCFQEVQGINQSLIEEVTSLDVFRPDETPLILSREEVESSEGKEFKTLASNIDTETISGVQVLNPEASKAEEKDVKKQPVSKKDKQTLEEELITKNMGKRGEQNKALDESTFLTESSLPSQMQTPKTGHRDAESSHVCEREPAATISGNSSEVFSPANREMSSSELTATPGHGTKIESSEISRSKKVTRLRKLGKNLKLKILPSVVRVKQSGEVNPAIGDNETSEDTAPNNESESNKPNDSADKNKTTTKGGQGKIKLHSRVGSSMSKMISSIKSNTGSNTGNGGEFAVRLTNKLIGKVSPHGKVSPVVTTTSPSDKEKIVPEKETYTSSEQKQSEEAPNAPLRELEIAATQVASKPTIPKSICEKTKELNIDSKKEESAEEGKKVRNLTDMFAASGIKGRSESD